MAQNINIMKANSKNGMAKKGSLRKTITTFVNNGISRFAGEKTTITKVVFNPKRYVSTFDSKLEEYFPIKNYSSREEQLKAYHRARFVKKQRTVIKAFSNC